MKGKTRFNAFLSNVDGWDIQDGLYQFDLILDYIHPIIKGEQIFLADYIPQAVIPLKEVEKWAIEHFINYTVDYITWMHEDGFLIKLVYLEGDNK